MLNAGSIEGAARTFDRSTVRRASDGLWRTAGPAQADLDQMRPCSHNDESPGRTRRGASPSSKHQTWSCLTKLPLRPSEALRTQRPRLLMMLEQQHHTLTVQQIDGFPCGLASRSEAETLARHETPDDVSPHGLLPHERDHGRRASQWFLVTTCSCDAAVVMLPHKLVSSCFRHA